MPGRFPPGTRAIVADRNQVGVSTREARPRNSKRRIDAHGRLECGNSVETVDFRSSQPFRVGTPLEIGSVRRRVSRWSCRELELLGAAELRVQVIGDGLRYFTLDGKHVDHVSFVGFG